MRWERVAISAIFFVHGAVFASWASRVPAVQGELHLPTGILGLVLAGPGLGALAGSQLGGVLVHRLGTRVVSGLAPVVLCIPLACVPAAHGARTLLPVLLALGAGDGCTSVAMNAQAVVVQERYGRTILNSLHAVRSVGAVAGGLVAVATASLQTSLTGQFVGVAALLAVISAAAAGGLRSGPSAGERPGGATTPRLPEPGADARRNDRTTVVLLAVMVFLAALVEDAPASWSGVYLQRLGADTATAAAGYTAFSAGEVGARLCDDWWVDRLGWVRLIRVGTVCCAAVLAVGLLAGVPWVMLGALFFAGAGISAVFPGVFAAAGTLPAPSLAMGHVGFSGNLGWLLVSPLVGGLATLVGLPAALGTLVLAALLVAGLAPVTRTAEAAGNRRTVAR